MLTENDDQNFSKLCDAAAKTYLLNTNQTTEPIDNSIKNDIKNEEENNNNPDIFNGLFFNVDNNNF